MIVASLRHGGTQQMEISFRDNGPEEPLNVEFRWVTASGAPYSTVGGKRVSAPTFAEWSRWRHLESLLADRVRAHATEPGKSSAPH
jgi:hypothetical protein